MRNLDEMIAEWRKRMAAGGIKSPAVLDELESHLREDVEREIRADEAGAFENAVKRMGRSELLKVEFAKIEESKEKRMSRIIGIACCAFAALYSMALAPALFFVHELSARQRALGLSAIVLTLLALITLRLNYKILPVIRNRCIRTWAVAASAFASVGWLMIFANLLPNVIVPRAMHEGASGESIRGSVLIGLQHAAAGELNGVFTIGLSLLWAMTLAAVLGGIAYGLEEAGKRATKMDAYV